MREIETKLNFLDREINALRQARNEAAEAGKFQEENDLSDKIDMLVNDYVLLNDKAMQLLDSSEKMRNVISKFNEMETRIEQESEELDKYSKAVNRATVLVGFLSDMVRLVV